MPFHCVDSQFDQAKLFPPWLHTPKYLPKPIIYLFIYLFIFIIIIILGQQHSLRNITYSKLKLKERKNKQKNNN